MSDRKTQLIYGRLSKILNSKLSFLYAPTLNEHADLLEQLIWQYVCSTKSKYLPHRISIKWVNHVFLKNHPCPSRYVAEYCYRGVLMSSKHKIFTYHGLIKKNVNLSLVKYFVSKEDFFRYAEQSSQKFNINKAIYSLRFLNQSFSAKNHDFHKYGISFLILLGILSYQFFDACIILSTSFSFIHNILKIHLITSALIAPNLVTYLTPICFFPIYTILIPLYIEPNKLKFMVSAISNLRYPQNRLDVKIILEEDDDVTHKALSLIDLPDFFQIINVPALGPRTKPKALNYALQYASGDYVTIFDAEDYPDSDQLIKSLQTFNTIGQDYVCVQAKLNFYNKDENLLTRMQSLEYTIWFDYLLQGLSQIKHFIPLGGTSCHFRLAELRKIGCWDPFNVTEDLDLGIRIYLKGYKAHMLDSTTLEEAVLSIFAWLRQRARWIKGFMQSYIVFHCNRTKFNLTLRDKIVIDAFVGLSVLHFLLPIYCILLESWDNPVTNCILSFNLAIGLIYLISSAALASFKQNKNLFNFKEISIIVIFLFYFILHTIAAYLALFELITAPFKWNKTKHGLSKVV
ncbi:glycosyltransferase [Candidatus Phycorickettsia trachydisci]|uniref:Glycosyltransferase n=2 Tax=Candidatus Phycorickettsia trachydisci TaxID=2115978 RepID=A0A2P1P9F8_9RICK|nr:glycosyltransferase [Candidatus Phycorickettsia trachydisci]